MVRVVYVSSMAWHGLSLHSLVDGTMENLMRSLPVHPVFISRCIREGTNAQIEAKAAKHARVYECDPQVPNMPMLIPDETEEGTLNAKCIIYTCMFLNEA